MVDFNTLLATGRAAREAAVRGACVVPEDNEVASPTAPLPLAAPATPSIPAIDLSPDQEEALGTVLNCLARGQGTVMLAGSAGTGKTTIMREAVRRLRAKGNRVLLAAPTHKAAKRLRSLTHDDVTTLHARIYLAPDEEGDEGEMWETLLDGALEKTGEAVPLVVTNNLRRVVPQGPNHGSFIRGYIPPTVLIATRDAIVAAAVRFGRWQATQDARIGGSGRLSFTALRPNLPCDVLVLDEASMVNERMADDVFEVNPDVRVLAVGDHCQLPPVEGKAGYPLADADAVLTRIHRQAEGSAVLRFAMEVREGRLSRRGLGAAAARQGVPLKRAPLRTVAEVLARSAKGETGFVGEGSEVCIVTQNLTRTDINAQVRKLLGFPSFEAGPPIVGERVIAVGTSPVMNNGEDGIVTAVEEGPIVGGLQMAKLTLDVGANTPTVGYLPLMAWCSHDPNRARAAKANGTNLRELGKLSKQQSWDIKRDGSLVGAVVKNKMLYIAPGYAVTAWKCQGSQYPRGLVLLESADWMEGDEWKVWYTAVTRFSESLMLILPT